jgi:hypothetical protein
MSWADDRVYLNQPNDVQAYDTTLPLNGAPGIPGEERWAYELVADGTKVIQKRKLLRNNTGGAVLTGETLNLSASSAWECDAKAAADSPVATVGGVVPDRVNGGTDSVPDGYWFWGVIRGEVDFMADAAVAQDALLVVKTASGAGRVDDPAVAGLEHAIVGRALAAAAMAGDLFKGYATIG